MAFLPWSIPISIVALLAVSSTAAAQAEPEDPRVPPEVAIQDKDYADARRTFATRLVKRGPSPQKAPTSAMSPLTATRCRLMRSSG